MREPTELDTAPKPTTEPGKTFEELGLPAEAVETLARLGIVRPTPIQEACIPPVLEGNDVVGKAETGTGKTIGFGVPIVLKVDKDRVSPQAIVLTPTRELAQQVAGVLQELGRGTKLKVALVVGGVHASEQVATLRAGAQVVVGTPGRVLDFLRERILSLVWCETVVLDEADRMLDMGFIDDVTAILDRVPEERQTLLFSATIPPEVDVILRRYMRNPLIFSTASGLATVPEIRQLWVEAEFPRKFRELEKILRAHENDTVIVFCNTRRQAIDLDRMLWGHGYNAAALHGNHEQDVRFRVLEAFRSGEVRILVATDVASRGLDIDDVACVVNYEIPVDPEGYVHRIGRTGRAKKSGVAVSLVSRKERSNWQRIVRQTRFAIEHAHHGRAAGAGEGHEAAESDGRHAVDRGSRRGRPERRPSGRGHERAGDRRLEGAQPGGVQAAEPPGPEGRQAGAGTPPREDRSPGSRGRRRRRGRRGMDRDDRARRSDETPVEARVERETVDADVSIRTRGRAEPAEEAMAEEHKSTDQAAGAQGAPGGGQTPDIVPEPRRLPPGVPEHAFSEGLADGAADDALEAAERADWEDEAPGGEGEEWDSELEDSAAEPAKSGGAPAAPADRRDREGLGGRSRRRRRRGGPDDRRPPGRGGPPGAGEPSGDRRGGREPPGPNPGSEAPSAGPSSPADRFDRQPKPQRRRLDEVDDDFVRTDYFSVDHSILQRSRPGSEDEGPQGDRPGGHRRRDSQGPPSHRHGPRRGGAPREDRGGRPPHERGPQQGRPPHEGRSPREDRPAQDGRAGQDARPGQEGRPGHDGGPGQDGRGSGRRRRRRGRGGRRGGGRPGDRGGAPPSGPREGGPGEGGPPPGSGGTPSSGGDPVS